MTVALHVINSLERDYLGIPADDPPMSAAKLNGHNTSILHGTAQASVRVNSVRESCGFHFFVECCPYGDYAFPRRLYGNLFRCVTPRVIFEKRFRPFTWRYSRGTQWTATMFCVKVRDVL